MAKNKVYGKTSTINGKDVTSYYTTAACTGTAIPGSAVLKDNLTGEYFLTETLDKAEKDALRAQNSIINVCKSAAKAIAALEQATARASLAHLTAAQSTKLVEAMVKNVAAFEVACAPKVKGPKGTAKPSYASLFIR